MIGYLVKKSTLLRPTRTLLGLVLCGGLLGGVLAAPPDQPGQTFLGQLSRPSAGADSAFSWNPSAGSPRISEEEAGPLAPGQPLPGPRVGDALAPHPLDLPVDSPPEKAPVITAIGLDRGNRLFATAGDDHLIRLWELPDGRLGQRLGGHRGWVRAVVFSPDGRYLAAAGDDRCVMLFRVGQEAPVWKAELGAAIYALAFRPDGGQLVAAGFSDKIWFLDSATGKQTAVWTAPGQDVRALAFSPDGGQLAAGSRNGVLRLWNTASGVRQYDLAAHQRRVRTVAYSPDGQLLVSGGDDGRATTCNPTTGQHLRVLAQLQGAVYAVAFCGPDRLAVGGTDNRIRLLRVSDGRVLRELAGHTGTVAALGWQSGTQTLISGGFDTTVRFWQLGPPPEGPLTQDSSGQPAGEAASPGATGLPIQTPSFRSPGRS